VVTLGAGAIPASAATPGWGYKQISPSDGSSVDIYGLMVSEDRSTVLAMTQGAQIPGMPSDGRARLFQYGLPRDGALWAVGPFGWQNGVQALGPNVDGISADGSHVLRTGGFVTEGSGGAFSLNAQGEAAHMSLGMAGSVHFPDANFDSVAFLKSSSPTGVWVGRPDQAPVQVSVDNSGNPMTATGIGAASTSMFMGGVRVFAGNAYTADGSSVIFTSTDGIPGDDDGGAPDVYRRVLTPGHEETYAISDANGSGDPDDPAGATQQHMATEYRWATADQSRVFFVTAEALDPGDTDGERDLYLRDGKGVPVRVSQGELVDGSPTGNGSNSPTVLGMSDPEWVLSSEDGNRTFFVSAERLTQDAPSGGIKLYERDVAEGHTRFVAGPLHEQDVAGNRDDGSENGGLAGPTSILYTSAPDVSFRGIRVTPDGAVFMSRAPLADSPDDDRRSLFLWTRDEGVEHLVKPAAGAPPSTPGFETILPFPFPNAHQGDLEMRTRRGGRAVTDDGSQVFFSTDQALTAQDTDGRHRDIYVWSAGDGVRLVSPPGRAPYDANYLDSSPDGSELFFVTAESILPTDPDPNAVDVYVALLGGGSDPRPQVPDADPRVCGGDGCQGPIVGVIPPSIGSVGFAGAGNPFVSPGAGRPSVSVSKVKAVIGSAATLRVRVPNAGRISVSGASLRRAKRSASKAGTYSLRIRLSSAAKKSLRKRKSLKVRARISYRDRDGRTVARTVSVTFKQPKAEPATTKNGGR
jgi:hypothetical protein